MLQSDIDHGRQRNQWGCAIVRAIQRSNPEAMRVRVNTKLIGFTIGETRYTFPTPQAAVEQIIKPFDLGEDVVPTTIRLTAGKMKDAVHYNDLERINKRRYNREYSQRPKTDRLAQMSPNYAEYERFPNK